MKKLCQLLTLATLLATSLTTAPIHDAVKQGDIAEVERLLAGGVSLHVQDNYGWTPLHRAAHKGHTEMVQLLIDHTDVRELDASVNARDSHGLTPLHLAAHQGHTKTVQFLIGQGASVNAQTNDGRTPLHCAAHWGWTETVQVLIARDASVDIQTNHGSTPLHDAARISRGTKAVRLLIDRGADVHAKNNGGMTPLHRAAGSKGSGCTETVRLLIDRGADVHAQDNEGQTPLYWAEHNNRTDTVRLLKTHIRLNKLLWHAVLNNNLRNAKWLLFHGASPHAIALANMFPITESTPEEDVICYLSAVIERKDTMMLIAVENRNTEMVKLLLAFGGKIDRPNNKGDTPLARAVERPEIMSVILEAAKKGVIAQ